MGKTYVYIRTRQSRPRFGALLLCRDNPSNSQVCHIKMLIRQHDYCTGVPLAFYCGQPLSHVQFYCIGAGGGGGSATHLLHIELIRLLIVVCGMLVHSSSMSVWRCWILAGTGTRCRIRRSRASQTCSKGDMSGEYAGHARTGMFSASRNCVQILATWGHALLCCNMRWWSWMNGTTMGLRISSRYLCAFKMPSIKCTCVRCP